MLRLSFLAGVIVVLAMMVRPKVLGIVDVTSEWRAVRVVRIVVGLIGAGIAVVAATELDLGRGLIVAPAILGAGMVAGVALSETVTRPGRRRSRRDVSPRHYVPVWPIRIVGGVVAVLLATLVLTMATASPDDQGRAGRALSHQCGHVVETTTPYPGSFYGVPLAEALLVIVGLTVAALFSVVRRPRGFTPGDVGDDALRRRSADMVISAAGAAFCAAHAGIAYFAGRALTGIGCPASWMLPVGVVLLVTGAAAVVLFAWFVRRLFVDPLITREVGVGSIDA